MFISDWSSDVCSSDLIKDKAKHVAPYHLLLARGGRLSAKHVIDARGAGKFPTLDCGWQKFVGQALTVKGGHGVEYPVVMDATGEQLDGYRFGHMLPYDPETVYNRQSAGKGKILSVHVDLGWHQTIKKK